MCVQRFIYKPANTIFDEIDLYRERKKTPLFQRNSYGKTSTVWNPRENPSVTPLGVSRKIKVTIPATLTHIHVENTTWCAVERGGADARKSVNPFRYHLHLQLFQLLQQVPPSLDWEHGLTAVQKYPQPGQHWCFTILPLWSSHSTKSWTLLDGRISSYLTTLFVHRPSWNRRN